MTDTAYNRRGYRFRNQFRTTLRSNVFDLYGAQCVACGWPGSDNRGAHLQMAHIVDHDHGGSDTDPTNFRPMCPPCHGRYDAQKRAARR